MDTIKAEPECMMGVDELKALYEPLEERIEARLGDFRRIWENGSDEELFTELVFCLLTPQSKARTCWAAVESLAEKSLIFSCEPERIRGELKGVRFGHRKAEYICLARSTFSPSGKLSMRSILSGFRDSYKAREWLVKNVLGMGYKEASHFLRNIGLGEDLAILDRHILKNLRLLGVIDDIPSTLSRRTYIEIESKMRAFSGSAGIQMGQLDLLLWCKEAGEIFK